MSNLLKHDGVEKRIFLIRGQKVMLDFDLAKLYGVPTKRLNEQVKRNMERFPEDFIFQLTMEEASFSRSQFATLKRGENIKYLPYAFTEQGVAMLSSVLKSKTAIQVNIAIMRTFVRLKQIISLNKELAVKLAILERKIQNHDVDIKNIFDAIRKLTQFEEKPKNKMGFRID